MSKGKLAFLLGLPRSGKSSVASQWINGEIQFTSSRRSNSYILKVCKKIPLKRTELCELGRRRYDKHSMKPRVIVCADDIRLALGHRWNSLTEGFVDATKHTMIRALLQNHDVLVDGTHTTISHIKRFFEIDPEAEFFFINTPPGICKIRAEETGQSELIPVIDRMSHQLMELVGVDHWDYMGWDAVYASINPLRMLAWEQTITD